MSDVSAGTRMVASSGPQVVSTGASRPTTRHRPRRRMNNRCGHRRVNRRVAGRDPDGGKRRISSGIHPSNTPTTWHRPRRMNSRNSPPTRTSPRPNNAHPAARLSHHPDLRPNQKASSRFRRELGTGQHGSRSVCYCCFWRSSLRRWVI